MAIGLPGTKSNISNNIGILTEHFVLVGSSPHISAGIY
jgi:hypothetical protein